MQDTRLFNLWCVVKPAPDLPGQWVAHVIELDLLTQGNDPKHAILMAQEACSMVIKDDIARGADPLERGYSLPEDELEELDSLLDIESMREVSLEEASGLTTGCVIAALRMRFLPATASGEAPKSIPPKRSSHSAIPTIRTPKLADACAV